MTNKLRKFLKSLPPRRRYGDTSGRNLVAPQSPLPRHLDRVFEWRDPPTNLSAIWVRDGQIRVEARWGISPLADSVEMT